MPVSARGVLVVVNANSFVIKEPPEGVDVLYRRQLRRWLQEQDLVLKQASIEKIFDVARRSSTWAT
jgi:ABC-type Na+ transport system ATPase subunit NatA